MSYEGGGRQTVLAVRQMAVLGWFAKGASCCLAGVEGAAHPPDGGGQVVYMIQGIHDGTRPVFAAAQGVVLEEVVEEMCC
jgi:hypothetical protein